MFLLAIFYFFFIIFFFFFFLVLLCLHKHSLDTTTSTSIDSEEINVDQLKKKNIHHTTTSFDILFHHRKHTHFDFVCLLSFWSAIFYIHFTHDKKIVCTSNTINSKWVSVKDDSTKILFTLAMCTQTHMHSDRKYLARIAQNTKAKPIHTPIN